MMSVEVMENLELELEYEGLLSNYYEKDKVHNIGDVVKI